MIKIVFTYVNTHKAQLAKFGLVGLTTACIYFLTFHFFYGLINIDYRVAASFAYILTVTTHFLLHRMFTFKAQNEKVVHHLWKYLLMLSVNYITMLTIIWFFVEIAKTSPYVALIISTMITVSISFFVMKYFIFKSRLELQTSNTWTTI